MHTGSENTGQTLSEDGTPTNADGALHLYKMLQQGKSREIKAEANRKICEFIVSLINPHIHNYALPLDKRVLTPIRLGYSASMGCGWLTSCA